MTDSELRLWMNEQLEKRRRYLSVVGKIIAEKTGGVTFGKSADREKVYRDMAWRWEMRALGVDIAVSPGERALLDELAGMGTTVVQAVKAYYERPPTRAEEAAFWKDLKLRREHGVK